MSENVTVALTTNERDVLLRGLRFVRSSIMLELGDPTPDRSNEHRQALAQVNSLVERLNREAASRK